jgi:hypothetical protein
MSFCRWSSNSYRCDLYAYESYDGYEIHVAQFRHTLPSSVVQPQVPNLEGDSDSQENGLIEYVAARTRFMAMLDEADVVPIGLPYDGQSFIYENWDWDGFVAQMKTLTEAGYQVPDGLIESLEKGIGR